MSNIKALTTAEFKEAVLEQSNLSVVDFWATWCGPCQMLSPVVDEVSKEFDDVNFFKVNVDEEPELTMQFGVKSIPTLAFIKDGKTLDISIGLISKDELVDFVKRNK